MASLLSSRSAGRSEHPAKFNTIPASKSITPTSLSNTPKLSLSTRSLSQHNEDNSSSPMYHSRSRSNLRTEIMSASSTNKSSSPLSPLSAAPSAKQSTGNHAKLHKRAKSNSLPGPPSPFVGGSSQFATPFATYEEPSPFPDVAASPPPAASSTPKIKPYLRKMSSAKEDQGSIDLSKSMAENDRLAGLGIQDFNTRSASDVNFVHATRRQHGRNTSVGSQISNASGTFRPGQPFTHPMTKTPRPYTPPAGASYASSMNDDEANESDDRVEDEFRLGAGFRSKRSMSISSANPTPLSNMTTASDLGLVPKLTSASQSNLSIRSNWSGKSSKKGRPRRGTDLSDFAVSPTSRPSIDKAFSLVSGRRSDTDSLSREDQIREARRKFEEKEARKDTKQEKEAAKRRESEEAKASKRHEKQRKQSTQSEKIGNRSATLDSTTGKRRRKASAASTFAGAEDEKATYGRSYEDYRPAHPATLPRYGTSHGESEKHQIQLTTTSSSPQRSEGNWLRFSTWVQTRMLSCGGKRS